MTVQIQISLQCKDRIYPSSAGHGLIRAQTVYLLNPFTWSGLFYHNSKDWSISNCRVSSLFSLLLCFTGIYVVNANSVHVGDHLIFNNL